MNKWKELFVATLISVICLYFAFYKVNLNSLLSTLKSANYLLVLGCISLFVFSMIIRSFRWRMILSSSYTISLRFLFESIMIGYFINSILPFRLGEFGRAYALSMKSPIGTFEAFGSIILERLIEIICLLFILIIALNFQSADQILNGNQIIFLSLLFIFLVIVLLNSTFRKRIISFFETKSIKSSNRLSSIYYKLSEVLKGFSLFDSKKNKSDILSMSFLLWFTYYLITILGINAIGLNLTHLEALFLLIFSSIVFSLPSAPGGIGPYHAAIVFIVSNIFMYDNNQALALAILLHAVAFVPEVLIGLFYFYKYSISYQDLKKVKIEKKV